MKNRTPGRLCLLNRDLEKEPLKVRSGKVLHSFLELDSELEELEEKYPIELALRKLGICPKSFPLDPFTLRALELYDLTHGGPNGTDLINLPCAPVVLDNPNIFFEVREIITIEKLKILKEKEEENARKSQN